LVAVSISIAFASLWLANLLTELASPTRARDGGSSA
jgi:hypothetical protein